MFQLLSFNIGSVPVSYTHLSMQENMIIELQRGNQSDFGELGKFRLQLTSEGAATAAEFKSDIRCV